MYVCMRVCTYVLRTYVSVYVSYACMHVRTCVRYYVWTLVVYECVYMKVCMYARTYVCSCVCMYICMYVSMFIRVSVCVYVCEINDMHNWVSLSVTALVSSVQGSIPAFRTCANSVYRCTLHKRAYRPTLQ